MGNQDHEPRQPRRPQSWNAEDKLRIVLAAAQLSDSEIGELLRREGLHTSQLEEWRQIVLAALSTRKPAAKGSRDAKKIRELERDLDRKDRALAEVAALLALQRNGSPAVRVGER